MYQIQQFKNFLLLEEISISTNWEENQEISILNMVYKFKVNINKKYHFELAEENLKKKSIAVGTHFKVSLKVSTWSQKAPSASPHHKQDCIILRESIIYVHGGGG